jgi:hypothetical protein
MKPKKNRLLFTAASLGIIDIASNDRPVTKAGKYGVPRVERELDAALLRASCRLGEENPHVKSMAEWTAEAKENIHTESWLQDKGEIAAAAGRGEREAQALMAEAVSIVTTNLVLPTAVWAPFFEMRSLAPADQLFIESEVEGMAITVDTIGADGGRQTIQSQPQTPSPIAVPIHMRGTPWIEYGLVDPYKGVVKEMALAQFDVARDRAYRMDTLLGSYIMVGETNTRYAATFTTTGAENLRDFILHPGVVAANLPTGNEITLSGNTTSSLFRKEVFDAIIEYASSWGDFTLEAGAMRPVEIIVSSKHLTHFLASVGFSSVDNTLTKQVFDGGAVVSYAGQTWVITGSNKISPTHGVAYVRFDQPIGVFATKPNLEDEIIDETPTLRSQNKGRICQNWAESVGLPLHWRKRTAAIRYRTAS